VTLRNIWETCWIERGTD